MSDGHETDDLLGRHPELVNRVAVVTGGARGIGQAIARRLAGEGMRLVLADRDGETLAATVAELDRAGATVVTVEGDLADPFTIDGLFSVTAEAYGTVDVLVNNAADLTRRNALDHHPELLDLQLATNVASPYLCSQRAAAMMRDRATGGVIVNVSSVGALRAHHRGLPYDITKGALNAMTQAMAIDLGRFGIRVNAVGPGVTHTYRADGMAEQTRQTISAQIPLGRFGTTAEIAAAVAFLASDEAAYITGQVLYVDGGITAQLSPPGPNPL
ncbi:MAG: glucose 1-dehydrogenase [Acidimicrobiia bacterium]|nr:glucose 1-dehydrogenase [Acidimicrobiia bacterium]